MADKKTDNKDIESGWIRELAAILHETGLTEIEIEKGEVRLRVSRAAAMTHAAVPAAAPAAALAAAPAPAASPAAAPARRAGGVPSPMVGTAYLAPSPGADPFVRKGDQVREGQTIMIIEAMKTMNPIAAPRSGAVVEIHVTDGQPVEYGEILAVIE
jgi:acetyl-CoA carboxylase biotin carboxyl carrier protein